jgi:alpha-glucosidase
MALHVVTSLPGTMLLYQGEELGLENGRVPAGEGADPLGAAEPGQSRDGARTPMPWRPVRLAPRQALLLVHPSASLRANRRP